MATERIDVIFTGRVQGIGFRATTAMIARRHPVTGWVRNEADGTVAMIAEGAPAALQRFLEDIAARFDGYITHTETRHAAATDEFNGFEIRY